MGFVVSRQSCARREYQLPRFSSFRKNTHLCGLLHTSTHCGIWVGKSAALLESLANTIRRHILSGQAIFADDTPVKMLAPGNGKTARFWAYDRDERPWGGDAPPAA
jgi:hypothetical protein